MTTALAYWRAAPTVYAPRMASTIRGGWLVAWLLALAGLLSAVPVSAARPIDTPGDGWVGALASYGQPLYPADFHNYRYVNPDAPKGGILTLSNPDRLTNFDKLNPFSVKGGYQVLLLSLVFETLCDLGGDEPYTAYGLLAQSMKPAPDDSSITFRIDPRARFSNGDPVTAADVQASFELVAGKDASPLWSQLFTNIKSASVLDARTIRFDLVHPDRSAMISLAVRLPIFSFKWGLGADGKRTPVNQIVKEPPIASGPYRVGDTDSGRRIEFIRRPDYWARDLPVRRGFFNYDRVLVKYYLDESARLEAFKAGEFDLMQEYSLRNWMREQVGARYDRGDIVKLQLRSGMGQYLQAYVLNLRRPKFRDPRVREALQLAYDFGVRYRQSAGLAVRADSVFTNTDFAATGMPSEGELALLAPFRAQLDPSAFDDIVEVPVGRMAPLDERLGRALDLMHQAGWVSGPDGILHDAAGQPFEFEYLTDSPTTTTEAAWQHNLERIGVRMRIRRADFALVLQRINNFEFDVFLLNPGNFLLPLPSDLEDQYGSAAADRVGSLNLAGIKDPALDALVITMQRARSIGELRNATRAFDRVFRSHHYEVATGLPLLDNFARWRRIELPAQRPKYFSVDEWFFHPLIWPVITSWTTAGTAVAAGR